MASAAGRRTGSKVAGSGATRPSGRASGTPRIKAKTAAVAGEAAGDVTGARGAAKAGTQVGTRAGTKAKSKAKRAVRAKKALRARGKVAKPRLRAGKRRRQPRPLLRPDLEASTVTRIIAAEADIHEGVAALRAACEVMAKVHDLAGPPPLRRREAGFEGLARIIVGQQLSVASAAAIWGRTEKLVQPFTPARLLALSDAELASAGLSGPKIRTLRAIAQACVDGLDLVALEAASDAHVHAALTAVNGIGPWTADIYLMFCLGRADAWAPGDLALQIAAQQAFGLKQRPDKDRLLEIAARWRPWRGVAARLLWAYYAVAKQKEKAGAIPV